MDVRNTVCDGLLADRIAGKEKTKRVESVANRLRIAQPVKRDNVERKPVVPEKERVVYVKEDPNRPLLERDLEEQNGGPGVYNTNERRMFIYLV